MCTCEVHGRRQMDEGKVVVQVELTPARMGEEVSGDKLGGELKGDAAHLDPALLAVLPHIVRTQHDPHGGGTTGAVGGSQDPP